MVLGGSHGGAKPLAPTGTTGRIPAFSPPALPVTSQPRDENLEGIFWELNGSFLPTGPEAHSRKLVGYSCWKCSPDSAFDNHPRARSSIHPCPSAGVAACPLSRWSS